jgi:hypothetical protein
MGLIFCGDSSIPVSGDDTLELSPYDVSSPVNPVARRLLDRRRTTELCTILSICEALNQFPVILRISRFIRRRQPQKPQVCDYVKGDTVSDLVHVQIEERSLPLDLKEFDDIEVDSSAEVR